MASPFGFAIRICGARTRKVLSRCREALNIACIATWRSFLAVVISRAEADGDIRCSTRGNFAFSLAFSRFFGTSAPVSCRNLVN